MSSNPLHRHRQPDTEHSQQHQQRPQAVLKPAAAGLGWVGLVGGHGAAVCDGLAAMHNIQFTKSPATSPNSRRFRKAELCGRALLGGSDILRDVQRSRRQGCKISGSPLSLQLGLLGLYEFHNEVEMVED